MTQTAYTVTTPSKEVRLIVKDLREPFPTTFALMATTAPRKTVVRISGGCKGMSADDKRDMLGFFSKAFAGYDGMVWSGATRQFDKEGGLDPMVTDIPGIIAAGNPTCVALGSTPRTDYLRLVAESRLVLDGYGTGINPAMAGVLVVQNGADGKSDWDGDLNDAFRLMTDLVEAGGFKRAGVIAWNGGPITIDEVMRSAKLGWPTLVIKGSGRGADEIADKLASGDTALLGQLPKNHLLRAVRKDDPNGLRTQLKEFGFIG